jgi:molybdopterin-dependent oxidoreductase alpha subunit
MTADDSTQPRRSKPAGGWGALKGTFRALVDEKTIGEGGRALLKVNQDGGFDCPGCAWPEPEHKSSFEFCENGAKAVAAETTSKRVTPAFFATHSIQDLRGQESYWLEAQGRLTSPMWLREGATHYEPIPWSEAFQRIGDALRSLPSKHRALFYTSGRTSNEAAFLYQLLARLYGTNNLPDCSNLCHESSGVGLGAAIGIGKGTVQLEDFELAEAIFVIGQNPGTNHPRMLSTLQEAARRGCSIVVINPLFEAGLVSFTHPQEAFNTLTGRGTDLATHYLRPKVGSDVALLKGMLKRIAEEDAFDREFISTHTEGFEVLLADIDGTSWDVIVEETGITQRAIEEAADVYIAADAAIVCWAMGITQHVNGVDNVQAIANLLLARGNIGKPGAGACPVRGHSNVQGDRTVGIIERPKEAFLQRLGDAFGFEPPREHGHAAVQAIEAMAQEAGHVFIGMGGNFALGSPDTTLTAEALANCALTVQISTKLNRSHLEHGQEALILPCLARSEIDRQETGPQRVTVEDSMGCVHASEGHREPPSEHLKSEPAIVAGIGQAMPGGERIDWAHLVADYARIRAKIEEVIPLFKDYEEGIDQPGGFRLRNAASEREWNTSEGKAVFHAVETPRIRLPEGALRLFTIRSHDQYNTTIYGMDDRYRGIQGERRVLFMNPEDMEDRGIKTGDLLDLEGPSDDGRIRRVSGFRAQAFDVPRECCAGYMPETNPLVPIGLRARGSHTPASKLIPIFVHSG